MPLEGDAQGLVSYALAKRGINLRVRKQSILPDEAVKTINIIWKDGMEKRAGYQKLSEDEVNGNNPINGLHRFYFEVIQRQLLASSGGEVKFLNAGVWDDIKLGLDISESVTFETWGSQDKVYMGNGVDSPFK